MDVIPHLFTASVLAIISTVVTVRILVAEMKKDIAYLKTDLDEIKRERKSDIAELKQLIHESNSDRKECLSKMDAKIDYISTALNDLKVQIAKK